MKKFALIAIRVAWLAICLTILVNSQKGYRGRSDWKAEEYLAFEMMGLSFPASYLVVGGLILAGPALGLIGLRLPSSSKVEMTVIWLLFVLAGYIQWFVVIPRFWRETRSHCSGR